MNTQSLEKGTVTQEYITTYLANEIGVAKCVLDSLIKVGGVPQFTIFKRMAACREMDRMYQSGLRTEEICRALSDKYGYSRDYLIVLPRRYRENFYEFNCCG